MKKMKSLLLLSFITVSNTVFAEFKAPDWANENATQKTSDIGEKIVNYGFVVVGVLFVIGCLMAAAQFNSGKGDEGKETLRNVFIGGTIASVSLGLFSLFT